MYIIAIIYVFHIGNMISFTVHYWRIDICTVDNQLILDGMSITAELSTLFMVYAYNINQVTHTLSKWHVH